MAAAQGIYHIIYKVQEFINKDPGIHFFFFPEIDQMPVDAIAAGPPFILIDQGAGILDIIHVLQTELVDLYTDSLEKGRDADGLIYRHGDIADAEFDRVKERMNPQVPPDLFGIVDAIGLYQQLYKIIIGFDAFKIFRYAGTGEFVEYFCPERLITCQPAFPERRVGAEGIDMR